MSRINLKRFVDLLDPALSFLFQGRNRQTAESKRNEKSGDDPSQTIGQEYSRSGA